MSAALLSAAAMFIMMFALGAVHAGRNEPDGAAFRVAAMVLGLFALVAAFFAGHIA